MTDVVGEPILNRRAWRGGELQERADWVVSLSREQVSGLYQLADSLPEDSNDWLGFGLDGKYPESLTELISSVATELGTGRGFALLRGIDPSDIERLRRVFWAFARGIGDPVMQNAKGEVLSIVADRFAGAEREEIPGAMRVTMSCASIVTVAIALPCVVSVRHHRAA